ncbi:MAG TPA: SurA N-terminal domain-containing protein [Candidatus Koribacter sp.]|jgi:hypothetical protein
MKALVTKLALALLLVIAAPLAYAGQVVDRLVATVDNVPILLSDWDHEVAMEALEQGRTTSSFTAEERRAVLDRLIDQQLIRAQMGDEQIAAADARDIDEQMAKIRASFSQDDGAWKTLLAKYGITEQLLRVKVAHQLQVMRFVDLRLRSEASIDRQDVLDYYNQTLIPEVQKNGGRQEPLTKVYSKIEEVLRQQRMDAMLTSWLHDLREHSDIRRLTEKNDGTNSQAVANSGGH